MIDTVTLISLRPTMAVSLLGLVENVIPTVAKRILVSLPLFYSRKAIPMQWKKSAPIPPLPLGNNW